MTALDFFARWRVRIGYLVGVVVLLLARPTELSLLVGGAVGLVGLLIRTYAAGYLHKQEVLTTDGPYALTRNPLYFGSSVLAAGAAVATHSWWAGVLLVVYFALVYRMVMRREEMEMRAKHGAAFDAYAARVPLFFPRLRGDGSGAAGGFRWAQYKKNHEYEAAVGFVLLMVVLAGIWKWRG